MSQFILYDDATARDFAPFALTRPAGELRAGARLIRERWSAILGTAVAFAGAPHLEGFTEFDAPGALRGDATAGTWLVNARCAPALDAAPIPSGTRVINCGDRVAAVRLDAPLAPAVLADGRFGLQSIADGQRASIGGWWLSASWDLVGLLPEMLLADARALLPATADARGVAVIGSEGLHVAATATVEPYVVADTSAGPVLIEDGAQVQAFTRLVGPCVIGARSSVLGGRISGCSIGPSAKVAGEMSVTIVIGHANKGHDGFVGHSVVGCWANLGAGTITSNLKNSYGEVTVWAPGGQRRSGLQFLGGLIGDHVKTGIGMRLPTGSVLGAAANVFGTRMPPKLVPPFAWGDGEPWETFALDRFLTTAGRVMARRQVALDAGAAAHWQRIFARRDT